MRILWNIHLYPPKHNCGSEWMAHNINKFLISRGHEIRVVLQQAAMHKIRTPYEFDGVTVTHPTGYIEQFQWAHILLTHLEYTAATLPLGKLLKRPTVHFVHNSHPYQSVMNAYKTNVVYNSKWIEEKLNYKWHSMVFTPFCDYDYINVNENPINNEYVALINLNENKGGKIFYDIARAMPDTKFLAVRGSYDEQVIVSLPNVKLVENTKDIREYYKQIKVILMPSLYESWGLVATEAMANGIPVICTTTPGLMENCGSAGMYVHDRENINEWIESINRLKNDIYYNEVSQIVRQRAKQLCDKQNLYNLEKFLYESLQDYRNK